MKKYIKQIIESLKSERIQLCEDLKVSYELGYRKSLYHALLEFRISFVGFQIETLKSLV